MQTKVIFPEGEKPLLLQPAKLFAQSAPVYAQIVRKLLAVKGDLERETSPADRLYGCDYLIHTKYHFA